MSNKPQNVNRSFSVKTTPISIKQEIDDDDDDMDHSNEDMMRPMEFLESIAKSNKKDKDHNMLQNVISNGQTISLTEAGKLVLNNYNNKDQQSQQNSSSSSNNSGNKNKLITIYPQSNIVLLSNNQNKSDHSNSPIKVVPKKPVFTEIKNAKAIPVNKLPFFQTKPGTNQVIKRYVLTNTNQSGSVQVKEEQSEIKRLQDEIKNLKKELEDYKGLIIAKDLEIEKLKKKINVNNCFD